MQARPKRRLIITLQLKNAEVYPGSNLHGTVILQLMHKHSHRHRTSSIESVDLTPTVKQQAASIGSSLAASNALTIIDRVSISVTGICRISESMSNKEHFPAHLRSEHKQFNILNGKRNTLGHALQLRQHTHESIQFDFVVQLPPILPCSYSGYFIQYTYYAQLFVRISKHVETAKCRVPFYVLPSAHNRKDMIPQLLTPKNLQERMSIFRKRNKSQCSVEQNHEQQLHKHKHYPNNSSSASSSSSTSSSSTTSSVSTSVSSPAQAISNISGVPPQQLLLPGATQSHFVENDILSTANRALVERNNLSTYLHCDVTHRNATTGANDERMIQFADDHQNGSQQGYCDEFDERESHVGFKKENKFRISLENECIGILLLNDTVFCDGDCVEGYLSLYTPCIVRITVVHKEQCGTEQHVTHCCSSYQCCWYIPSFAFSLKIPNNAFKSFRSDLCESGWTLNFQFAISKHLLTHKAMIRGVDAGLREFGDMEEKEESKETLGYLNSDYNVWELYEKSNEEMELQGEQWDSEYQVDKVLQWQLPIVVTTMHNPLRCVTRSNAVIVKC